MKNVFCDVLFPTIVVYNENEDIINESIVSFARKIVKENYDKPFYSPCYSTVNKLASVLDYKEFSFIKQRIINCLGAYLQRTKIKKENLKFSCSWINLYEQHGYQDLHNHNRSMISGVFYLKSDGNKDLIFQSPAHFFQPIAPEYEEKNIENCWNVEYESKVGRCFIFPSHLMHRTLPATSERISLSFNIIYDKE